MDYGFIFRMACNAEFAAVIIGIVVRHSVSLDQYHITNRFCFPIQAPAARQQEGPPILTGIGVTSHALS